MALVSAHPVPVSDEVKEHRSRTLLLMGVLHAFTHPCGVALLPLSLHIQQDFKLIRSPDSP